MITVEEMKAWPQRDDSDDTLWLVIPPDRREELLVQILIMGGHRESEDVWVLPKTGLIVSQNLVYWRDWDRWHEFMNQ